MQTSTAGIAFLERHEGVVLRAYRDPVGIWTIGAGLTAASGVVKPVAGMVITQAEASSLLAQALRRNYEPAVARALPGSRQHEFDAGVSFHFNTGAIARASWVGKWIKRDWAGVKYALGLWNKGGGKVLPGLTRRRAEEYGLMRFGDYGAAAPPPAPPVALARYVAPITAAEMPAIRAGLARLGYSVPDAAGVGVPLMSVFEFQRDHGLTADGIIGRATASTLQRVLDARAKTAAPAALMGAGAAEAAADTGVAEAFSGLPWAGEIAMGLALLRLSVLAWRYRDAIAPIFDTHLPRVAAFLRSF